MGLFKKRTRPSYPKLVRYGGGHSKKPMISAETRAQLSPKLAKDPAKGWLLFDYDVDTDDVGDLKISINSDPVRTIGDIARLTTYFTYNRTLGLTFAKERIPSTSRVSSKLGSEVSVSRSVDEPGRWRCSALVDGERMVWTVRTIDELVAAAPELAGLGSILFCISNETVF
jgi:hypothetical protein